MQVWKIFSNFDSNESKMMQQQITKISLHLVKEHFLKKRNERLLHTYLNLITFTRGRGWISKKDAIALLMKVTQVSQRTAYRRIQEVISNGFLVKEDKENGNLVVKGKKKLLEELNKELEYNITSRVKVVFFDSEVNTTLTKFKTRLYEMFATVKQSQIEYRRGDSPYCETEQLISDHGLKFLNSKEGKFLLESSQENSGCALSLLSKFIGVPKETLGRYLRNTLSEEREVILKKDLTLGYLKFNFSRRLKEIKSNPRLTLYKNEGTYGRGSTYKLTYKLSNYYPNRLITKV